MSDLNVSARDTQPQLDELKQDQESRLQRLRADYQKREAALRESGDAAVNHIRANNAERLDQVRDTGTSKVKQEADSAAKNYADLRKRVSQQREGLEQQAHIDEEQVAERVNIAHKNESQTMAQTNEQLRDFVAKQNELRIRAEREAVDDVNKTRTRENEQLTQAKAQSAEHIQKTKSSEQQAIEDIKAHNRELYNETKAQADRRVTEARRDGETKVATDRDQKNHSLGEMQRKYTEEMNSRNSESAQRIASIEKEELHQSQDIRERALLKNEQVQAEYGHEAQRVQVEGEQDIHDRQVKFDQLKNQQVMANHERLGAIQGDFVGQESKLHKEYQDRMQFESQKLREDLASQRAEFKKNFDTGDRTYKDELHNQKDVFLRELYKQKQRFDNRFGVERARADDPFYRIKTFDANLSENSDSYVLTAKVAPHETSTVDLIVKDNKIVLSAKRAYEDSFADPDGSRASTNSYQTYRQEFKLDVPVDGAKAFRKIDSDGNITVIAPKKGAKLAVR